MSSSRASFGRAEAGVRLGQGAGSGQPFCGLAGDAGDLFEMSVIVEEHDCVKIGDSCDQKIDRPGAAMPAAFGKACLDAFSVQRPMLDKRKVWKPGEIGRKCAIVRTAAR